MIHFVIKFETLVGSILLQPIFPQHDPGTVVGFLATTMLFEVMLRRAFSDTTLKGVRGVDCVVSSGISSSATYRFTVRDGDITLSIENNHEPSEDGQCPSLSGNMDGKDYFSVPYSLCLYYNSEFAEIYSTSSPLTATMLTLIVVFLTGILFCVYDFAVRRAFNNKRTLLNAKRRFMRYVSHEVRSMGALLQSLLWWSCAS